VIEIRSYRRVFELERRIYRLDHLRLNPGGIPVRGIVYLLAILAGLALVSRGPLVGPLLSRIPWYLLDVALPVSAAALLGVMRLEGRPFHLAALSVLRRRLVSARHVGLSSGPRDRLRWGPGSIAFLADGGDARMRAMLFRGPGAAVVAVPHTRTSRRCPSSWLLRHAGRRSELLLRPDVDCGRAPRREVIVVAAGAQLRVRPGRRAHAGR
jgi:hypothetical protein